MKSEAGVPFDNKGVFTTDELNLQDLFLQAKAIFNQLQ